MAKKRDLTFTPSDQPSQPKRPCIEPAEGNAASVATNRPRNLQLRFLTELSLPPKKKLEGKGGAPIVVELIDADMESVVRSGPESTITLDVVVLEGDFNTEDNWDREEFERYEIKEREGSGPLLTGLLQVKLKDGRGQLGEVTFNDHSNCNRNRRFRIGLKVASGCCENTRIREAKTDAFLVNECRGEASLKLYPRASDDLIRSLQKKIEKSPQNPNIEQNFISDHGMSKKSGNCAKTSELRCYLYCPNGMSEHGVAFDKSGMLIGLLTKGTWFLADQLSNDDKKHGRDMVSEAIANPKDIRRSWGEKETAEKMMRSDMSNTSDGRQFDLLFKRCSTKADIQRAVREEPEPDSIKRILDLITLVWEELVKSQLLDIVKSDILNAFKREVVPEICPSLEDTIRRVVREELKHASSQPAQLERSSGKCQEKDEVRNLRLEFINNLPCSVYTGDKLKVLHSLSYDVKLVNANTGSIVKSGPESSFKLNVVALEGGFKTDDDKWTCKTFDQSVLKEREGKRPLLIGELELTLKEGTGVLGDVEFTDGSRWTRSRQFRIGFQVSHEYRENIREAVTDPFTVKWRRGKASEKHFPPFPNDALWRLKNIGKNGAFCKKLNDARIDTVKDFVQQLNNDSEKLRKILGEAMTDNMWDDLVDHAKSCSLNGERHVGHNNESDHDVISDNVGQRTGLTSDGVRFAADKFLKQKEHGDKIRGASISFPSHFEGETENLTPFLAPRTCAAPVGREAPSANAISLAKDQPTYANIWNCLIPPGDNGIITGGLLTESYDVNSQFAMPSHAINSSRRMDSTANEDFLLSRPSLASTSYGQNHVTALPSTAQTPHTYFRNPFESSANELGHLASHQPISKNNWDDLISPGDNVITIGGSSTQSNDISSQDALCNQMFGPWRKNDAAVNQLALPSEPPSAPPPEGEYVTEDLASDDVDYVLRYLAEPDVDTNFQTMPWKDGSV